MIETSADHELILLGTDFLARHHARIHLSPPGRGDPPCLYLHHPLAPNGTLRAPIQVYCHREPPSLNAVLETSMSAESGGGEEKPAGEEENQPGRHAPACAQESHPQGTSPHEESLGRCTQAVVYTTHAIKIPPWSETVIALTAPANLREEGSPLLVSPAPEWNTEATYLVAHTLSHVKDGKVLVRLLNPSRGHTVLIQPMTALARVEAHGGNEATPRPEEPTVEEVWADLRVDKELTHLDERQRDALRRLIAKHLPVFSNKPGCTHVLKHCIPTTNGTPISVKARRTSEKEQEIIDAHVGKLLEDNLKDLRSSLAEFFSLRQVFPRLVFKYYRVGFPRRDYFLS